MSTDSSFRVCIHHTSYASRPPRSPGNRRGDVIGTYTHGKGIQFDGGGVGQLAATVKKRVDSWRRQLSKAGRQRPWHVGFPVKSWIFARRTTRTFGTKKARLFLKAGPFERVTDKTSHPGESTGVSCLTYVLTCSRSSPDSSGTSPGSAGGSRSPWGISGSGDESGRSSPDGVGSN